MAPRWWPRLALPQAATRPCGAPVSPSGARPRGRAGSSTAGASWAFAWPRRTAPTCSSRELSCSAARCARAMACTGCLASRTSSPGRAAAPPPPPTPTASCDGCTSASSMKPSLRGCRPCPRLPPRQPQPQPRRPPPSRVTRWPVHCASSRCPMPTPPTALPPGGEPLSRSIWPSSSSWARGSSGQARSRSATRQPRRPLRPRR